MNVIVSLGQQRCRSRLIGVLSCHQHSMAGADIHDDIGARSLDACKKPPGIGTTARDGGVTVRCVGPYQGRELAPRVPPLSASPEPEEQADYGHAGQDEPCEPASECPNEDAQPAADVIVAVRLRDDVRADHGPQIAARQRGDDAKDQPPGEAEPDPHAQSVGDLGGRWRP